MITLDIRKSNKVNGDWGVFVSFPYNADVVSLIRGLPTRYWDMNTKEWEVPLSKLGFLINNLADFEINLKGNFNVFSKKTVNAPTNFEFKTKPFDHQIDGFNYGINHDKWLLGDEQGLGKTKQVIDIAVAQKLLHGYKHCLIICGVNGLKWNWANEVKTHSNESAYILGQRPKKRGGLKIGSMSDRLDDVKRLKDIEDYFIITNVETLRDKDIATKLNDYCKNGTIGIVAVDEMHKCKNPTSQQGKGLLKINPKVGIAMTGTPLMNNPLDLYIILKWLGYEKHAFGAFKKHHCEMGGFGGYEILGYKNLNELQERINEFMLRRLKEDVLDLPEKTFINEYVEMTPKQSVIYKEILNDLLVNIDRVKSAPNPLSEMIRLRQATGFTGILSSEIKESAKLDRMVEIVEDAVANNRKVAIFSNWTSITDEVLRRLKCFNPATITGNTSDEQRPIEEYKFQNDPTCKVIVGTIGAMGTGLTLTAGTVEIFLDEPWTMAAKNQAIDRCHRIGSTKNVTIYTLLTKDTIDERINELVTEKGELADSLIDGKVVGNKATIVDYLLR